MLSAVAWRGGIGSVASRRWPGALSRVCSRPDMESIFLQRDLLRARVASIRSLRRIPQGSSQRVQPSRKSSRKPLSIHPQFTLNPQATSRCTLSSRHTTYSHLFRSTPKSSGTFSCSRTRASIQVNPVIVRLGTPRRRLRRAPPGSAPAIPAAVFATLRRPWADTVRPLS